MIGPEHMKSLIVLAALLMWFVSPIPAQEESASPAAEKKSYPEVPKEYEVGESTVSPNGRFAILYPVRNEDSNGDPGLAQLARSSQTVRGVTGDRTRRRCYLEGRARRGGRKMERQRLGGGVASQEMGRRGFGCL